MPLQHKLIGFYNPDEKCLQRGTDWEFKYNSGLNENLRSAHTVYLCVLCGSENKQRLFPFQILNQTSPLCCTELQNLGKT